MYVFWQLFSLRQTLIALPSKLHPCYFILDFILFRPFPWPGGLGILDIFVIFLSFYPLVIILWPVFVVFGDMDTWLLDEVTITCHYWFVCHYMRCEPTGNHDAISWAESWALPRPPIVQTCRANNSIFSCQVYSTIMLQIMSKRGKLVVHQQGGYP